MLSGEETSPRSPFTGRTPPTKEAGPGVRRSRSSAGQETGGQVQVQGVRRSLAAPGAQSVPGADSTKYLNYLQYSEKLPMTGAFYVLILLISFHKLLLTGLRHVSPLEI